MKTHKDFDAPKDVGKRCCYCLKALPHGGIRGNGPALYPICARCCNAELKQIREDRQEGEPA